MQSKKVQKETEEIVSPLTPTRTREVVPIGPTPLPTRTREGVSSLLLLELGRMCPPSSNRSRVECFPSTFIKLGRVCPLLLLELGRLSPPHSY